MSDTDPTPGPNQASPTPQGSIAPDPRQPGSLAAGDAALSAAPDTRTRTYRRVAVIASVIAGALVLGFGVVALTGGDGGEPGAEVTPTGPVDVGEIQFAAVKMNVGRSQTFTIKTSYSLGTLQIDGRQAYASDVIGVYLDPLLRIPAPDVYINDVVGPMTVSPKDEPLVGFRTDTENVDAVSQVELNVGGRWGFSEQYYIAEYLDPATGARLPEPKVTLFTVPTDAPATSVAFEADDQGVGHFSWDPIEGAEHYYIVSVTKTPTDGVFGEMSHVELIGDTTDTTWTTIEQDQRVQEGLADAAGSPYAFGVISQNSSFTTYLRNEDRMHEEDGLSVAAFELPDEVIYGVIAETPAGLSPLSVLADDIAGTLPISIAFNAAAEMGTNGNDVHVAAQLPTQMPVTISNGRTVLRPIHYDVDGMIPTETALGVVDDAGAFTKTGVDERYHVNYTVSGTLISGGYTLDEPDLATAQDAVRTVVAKVQAETAKTGVVESYTYLTRSSVFDPEDVSTTAPEVDYPVNGTNPLSLYLAANLVAGEEYVDLSAYLAPGSTMTTSGIDYRDAFVEARQQNPFILGRIGMGYDPATRIMGIGYGGYDTPDDRVAEQELLAEEVAAVTSRIITDGMGEQDTVRAINAYLISSAEYDYVALDAGVLDGPYDYPNAWTATGVLIDKRGVCASYAKGFQALADAAGLESMYVTGSTLDSGSLHAWNKVRVDGVWRVVDVTWNDSPVPDQYLLVTDAQINESRTQDYSWVVDSRVGDYAAN